MSRKTTASLKISKEVKQLVKYLGAVTGYNLLDVIIESINVYKKVHKGKVLSNIPVQEPRRVENLKTINVTDSVRNEIKRMSIHQIGGMVGAMDRVVITYQNSLKKVQIPDNIRVDWLDKSKLKWQNEIV
jgi:hypothetical protein